MTSSIKIVLCNLYLIGLTMPNAPSLSKTKVPMRAILIVALISLSACASRSPSITESTKESSVVEVDQRNRQITQSAAQSSQKSSDTLYRLGAGDLLDLSVFRVDDLNRKIRVNGAGQIELPLLGTLNLGGLTVSEAQNLIADRLRAEYLRDPQVSLYIQEYRSQEITVMGGVTKPDVYTVKKSRSIFEMLSLAGGLSKTASDLIRVKTVQVNEQNGKRESVDLLMSLNRLLAGDLPAANFQLRDGDSILVPEAGFVTVEGAVNKPGSYKMDGETNVLKAIALAGGMPWTGKQGSIRVIRNQGSELIVLNVNLASSRANPRNDVVLQDGDVVSVAYSPTKRAVSGFFKTAGQIFGYRIN